MIGPTDAYPPERHQQPYGRAFFLLGLRAVDALHDLCDVPNRSTQEWTQWLPSDTCALQGWFNIEEKADIAFSADDVSKKNAAQVDDLLFRYRVALPYDEAERHWLYDAYGAAWGPDSIQIIRNQEARVMSSGLQRVLLGRDLVRRWWAWRRETDEYSGQGSAAAARETLRKMIETLSPDLDLPEPYLALRLSCG